MLGTCLAGETTMLPSSTLLDTDRDPDVKHPVVSTAVLLLTLYAASPRERKVRELAMFLW
jgi:hypothetical protein